jgi:hypothetical protein
MLPLLTVLLLLPGDVLGLVPRSEIGLVGAVELLSLLAAIFSIGFLGTQRIWFQRVFDGRVLTPMEAWTLTWGFFGRYMRLGLVVGIPAFAGFAWLAVYLANGAPRTETGQVILPAWWIPFWLIYGFVLDVLLTFVTPALAYTTKRVRKGLNIGISLIARTWPQSAAYVLVPPLTLLALTALNPRGLPALVSDLLAIVSILVGLLVKGSIAAFYLRQVPTEPG